MKLFPHILKSPNSNHFSIEGLTEHFGPLASGVQAPAETAIGLL